ncbi:MAG: SDR family oxidoreductase [Actinobacteria bacterium]|nr:SDR family oxidoreductase [Actinomycetota bacterium]MCB9389249.1 SDR family oxidoreductase [Acidimicrobiia bacterium]
MEQVATTSDRRLSGKRAFITGVSSGIGLACAQRFLAEGAVVGGFDIQPLPSGDDADPRGDLSDDVGPVHLGDVRDETDVKDAVALFVEQHGGIDVLVNAAGVSTFGAVHELSTDEWDRVVDINLKGTYLVCKHVTGHMVAAGSGSIINLASVEGIVGFASQAAYNASKGGVVLLTRNMACDYGPAGVRVNCICPGLVETPMTAPLSEDWLKPIHDQFVKQHLLGRAAQASEIASAAFFLASDDASFVHGHSLVVDGGLTAGRRLDIPGTDV